MQSTGIDDTTRGGGAGRDSSSRPAPASVVAAAAAGDDAAFRQLYEDHARPVFNMALRSTRDPRTAEDVTQEVWMKVHRELPKLREPGAFTLWLYRVASKLCIDAARRRARRPPSQGLPDEIVDARPDPESRAVDRDQSRLTWEALATLPAQQHLALYLKEVEGRSYREISRVLDISETAVGLRLLRARRSFQTAYERLHAVTREQRCGYARTVMTTLIDGEANAVQRRAVRAHVDGCGGCARELVEQRGVARRYAALALAPVPAVLSARIFVAHTAAAAGGAMHAGGVAQLLVSSGVRAKTLAVALTAGTGLTVAALVAPGPVHDSLRTSPDPQAASASLALPPQTDGGAAAPTLAARAPTDEPGAASVGTATPTAGGLVGRAPGQIIASVTEIGNTVTPYLAPALPPLPNATISVPPVTEPLKPLLTPVAPLLPEQVP